SNQGADNLTDDLRARGLTSTSRTNRTYEANGAVGGRIKQDKLWFFTAHRLFGFTNQIANNYHNLTQNTPFYTPDLSNPGLLQQSNRSNGIRLTYQVSAKDKISVSWDNQ